MTERRDGRYSQSLERGLAILRCFGQDRPLLGIAEIADHVNMSRLTTHRYVTTLLALGFLEQDSSRKYRLGLGVTDLGLAALGGSGIRRLARPLLERLRPGNSYCAGLAVLDGAELCWLDTANGASLRMSPGIPLIQPGARAPAHRTAEGKVLIAFQPAERRTALLSQVKLTPIGPNTIRTNRELLDQLDAVLDRGFALADEEQAPGVRAIAAPVRDRSDEVIAAVSLTLESSTMPLAKLAVALGPEVLACADRLSALLGHGAENGSAGAC
jgi:IclR family pca regulon transcriptional regulator